MTPPHFYIFVTISPLKWTWPFIWTNLNSLHPRIICTKFDWIWPSGSEENFKKFSVYFYSSAIISPWRRVIRITYPLHLNKLEFPVPKDGLCEVWLKFAQWFWRLFSNDHFYIFMIAFNSLWRGPGPLFEQTWILFTRG